MATSPKTNRHAARTPTANRRVPARENPDTLRADKVALARKLMRDPNYPPPKVVRSVARSLARDWTAEPQPSRRSGSANAQPAKASCTT